MMCTEVSRRKNYCVLNDGTRLLLNTVIVYILLVSVPLYLIMKGILVHIHKRQIVPIYLIMKSSLIHTQKHQAVKIIGS